MAATLPPPKVPDLGADNAIDLDRLGSDDLETIVDYPGIAEGDHFWPQWWGCTASGEAVDNFSNLIVIGPGDLTPEGMPVQILNNRMRELDQGWVFYSYKLPDSNTPDEPGEESLRRFFYVGNPTDFPGGFASGAPLQHFFFSGGQCDDCCSFGLPMMQMDVSR